MTKNAKDADQSTNAAGDALGKKTIRVLEQAVELAQEKRRSQTPPDPHEPKGTSDS